MDRRLFLKSVLTSSLAVPLAAGLVPGSEPSRDELFVIADAPGDVVPGLLRELSREGLVSGKTYTFSQAHPFAESLGPALREKGWRQAGADGKADMVLTFSPLRQACSPSFTLVKGGRVVDARRAGLLSLWKDMSRSGRPSTTLTMVAFRPLAGARARGERATVVLDGRRADHLDLGREFSRTYETPGGFITVRVDAGGAHVTESSCRHQVCVASWPVRGAGERIICAPNRFLLTVEGRGRVDTMIG